MTLCNMSIEAGARVALIAPDEVTFDWLKDRPMAPKGPMWDAALGYWRTLPSDQDARFDREVLLNAAEIVPHVTWGTSPEDAVPVTGCVPDPASEPDPLRRARMVKALAYMGVTPGQPVPELAVDIVFLGSCTNGRLSDLRAAAEILRGRTVAPGVRMIVVPGSGLVKEAAEAEGLDRIFTDAGAEWRAAGCSMCVGMNGDTVAAGERSASTSNRNFEGRQGRGARTHLLSPATAAATAVTGRICDPRPLDAPEPVVAER